MSNRTATPAEFVGEALECFERAAQKAGLHERDYLIGGQKVRLRFAGEKLLAPMTRALAHRAVPRHETPDLQVCYFDSESTRTAMARPAWDGEQYTGHGGIAGFGDDNVEASYQMGWDVFQCLDRGRKAALYWTPSWKLLPWWEATFPLRVILHWWLRDTPWQPVHAAGVGTPEGGVLITGRCGSGKSTSALACLGSGLQYAGDDYTLASTETPAQAECLYNTAKLEPDGMARFPELAAEVVNRDRLDREKAMVYLHESRPGALVKEFPIRALVLPEVTGLPDTRIAPAPQSMAMLALAPTTTMHLPAARANTVAKLGRLTKSVPCYRLLAGTDLKQIPAVLEDLLRKLNAGAGA